MSEESVVTISGNATRDPELRYTTGGKAVTSFGVAVNRRHQVNGEWTDQVSFLTVQAWDRLAENVCNSVVKGSRIIVTGRLQTREYERKDKSKATDTEIVATDIGLSLRWDPAESAKVQRERPQSSRPDPVYGDEEPF